MLPAYALLQSAGSELAKDVVAAMKLPVDARWFAARETTHAALAPPLSAKAFLAGVITVFTPLLTGAVSTFLTGKVDKTSEKLAPKHAGPEQRRSR